VLRLGVVSFLNSRPLIAGLESDAHVRLVLDVPAALPGRLERGEVDVSLIPVLDVLRGHGQYRVVSDACIGCDGETMTVRIFSQVPPDRIRTLWVDTDSHTSVALARVLWRELYVRDLESRTIDTRREDLRACEAVLLIGDKVVSPQRGSFAYEVDLGGAWRQHTGLPFVFAVWAMRTAMPNGGNVAALLEAARDRGVARAAEIADTEGPSHGWPAELARRYLMRCLKFRLDDRSRAGVARFAHYCLAAEIVPPDALDTWMAQWTPRPVPVTP